MKTLAKDFSERNEWQNNRSSAVYPLYIKDKSDFILTFINYWKMKNKINNVFIIISIFKEDGEKYGQKKLHIKDHNEISISNVFNLKKFKGIAHVEFFSEQNLRFPLIYRD